MRAGWITKDKLVLIDMAEKAEKAGAELITDHRLYSGLFLSADFCVTIKITMMFVRMSAAKTKA